MKDLPPEIEKYFEHAAKEMIPNLRKSAASMTIFSGKIDVKLCCELGAAILLDRPLIFLVPDRDVVVPANVKRVATAVIYGDPDDPGVQREIREILRKVMASDIRAKDLQ